MTAITATVQVFFSDRLAKQRQASGHTIAAYRDTLRLLFAFVQSTTGKLPSHLDWSDLDQGMISAFLNHLETKRHNSARTRNARLGALRSLFRYAALQHPEHADVIARVLAIPPKRFEKQRCPTSPPRRSTHCWPRRTSPPGRAAATTPG
ncbi:MULTISPECIES: site-specific integrase [Cryobacterium]|uniref:site-specific integrase n=1 Tax=Cryobacterium TaxID=69578 RepID=UPI0018E0A466|nr:MULTISPECIES: site-specific integrase [Cryobacterium]